MLMPIARVFGSAYHTAAGWKTDELCRALRDNDQKTKHVNCGFKRFDPQGFVDVFEALAENTSCESCQLGGSGFDDQAAVALASALRRNRTLKSINVGGNPVGDDGAEALAAALHFNNSLKWLCLGNTNIGDRGAIALAGAIMANHELEYIDLAATPITNVGAAQLAEAAAKNRTLQTIDLGWTNVFTAALIGNSVSGISGAQMTAVERAVKGVPTTLESSRFASVYGSVTAFEDIGALCSGIERILIAKACRRTPPIHLGHAKGLADRLKLKIVQDAANEVRRGAGIAWTSDDGVAGTNLKFYSAAREILSEDGPLDVQTADGTVHLLEDFARYCQSLKGYLVVDRSAKVAQSRLPMHAQWFFLSDSGAMTPFDLKTNSDFEREYRSNPDNDAFILGDSTVNFATMQMRSSTAVRRLDRVHDHKTMRGTWLKKLSVHFFAANLTYRYSGFLASSDSDDTALNFLNMRHDLGGDPDFVPVMFVFHFDPDRGCDHVNLLEEFTLVPNEREWLFQHYSAFRVLKAADLSKPYDRTNPVFIEVDVLPDNRHVDADVPLAFWH